MSIRKPSLETEQGLLEFGFESSEIDSTLFEKIVDGKSMTVDPSKAFTVCTALVESAGQRCDFSTLAGVDTLVLCSERENAILVEGALKIISKKHGLRIANMFDQECRKGESAALGAGSLLVARPENMRGLSEKERRLFLSRMRVLVAWGGEEMQSFAGVFKERIAAGVQLVSLNTECSSETNRAPPSVPSGLGSKESHESEIELKYTLCAPEMKFPVLWTLLQAGRRQVVLFCSSESAQFFHRVSLYMKCSACCISAYSSLLEISKELERFGSSESVLFCARSMVGWLPKIEAERVLLYEPLEEGTEHASLCKELFLWTSAASVLSFPPSPEWAEKTKKAVRLCECVFDKRDLVLGGLGAVERLTRSVFCLREMSRRAWRGYVLWRLEKGSTSSTKELRWFGLSAAPRLGPAK